MVNRIASIKKINANIYPVIPIPTVENNIKITISKNTKMPTDLIIMSLVPSIL